MSTGKSGIANTNCFDLRRKSAEIIIIIIIYLFITPLRQHSKIQADKQYRTHKDHER